MLHVVVHVEVLDIVSLQHVRVDGVVDNSTTVHVIHVVTRVVEHFEEKHEADTDCVPVLPTTGMYLLATNQFLLFEIFESVHERVQ